MRVPSQEPGSRPGSTPSRAKASLLLLRVAVTLGVLGVLVWKLPVDVMLGALARVPLVLWALVVLGFLAGHVIAALKWRGVLRAAGIPLATGRAFQAHGAGLFANLCLPSLIGGDLIRAGLVMARHGRAEALAIGSFLDRVCDLLALTSIAAAAALLTPIGPGPGVTRFLTGLAILLPALILIAGMAIRRIPIRRLPARLAGIAQRLRQSTDSVMAMPGVAIRTLGLSLAIQASFVMLNVALARAVGIDAPLAVWFLGWPLAKMAALAPVSLGGIGVREAALAGLLTPFGLEPSRVVAQSLAWEAVLIISGLIAGITVLLCGRQTAPVRGGDP